MLDNLTIAFIIINCIFLFIILTQLFFLFLRFKSDEYENEEPITDEKGNIKYY